MQYTPNYNRAEEERIQQQFAASLKKAAEKLEASKKK